MQRIFNRSTELEKRRRLRAQATREEKLVWSKLRDKRLCGIKFRRQYSIGPYIVDFYCPAAKLAIEIDGGVHYKDTVQEYDKDRDEFIKSFGINTVRFSNEDIRSNISLVLDTIKKKIISACAD